tara:strand:+ start:5059 stop:6150 length:1092 start_codon:yes stop_codon:yes gene_type:complete
MTYDIKNLNVASLDFDDIVSSLTSFFQQQPELVDINFTDEGTAANMLIQILATSTAYAGVYAQFGYTNSWPVTANMVEGVLAAASLNSILIPYSQSAKISATLSSTISGGVLRYTTFNAQSANGSQLYFYNIDPINSDGVGYYTNLYAGTGTVVYTNYDYTSQSCIIPKDIDPRTISFYTEDVSGVGAVKTYWTRVDKGNNTSTGNQNIFTVMHSSDGNYLVTNNLPNAATITTSKRVSIQGVLSSGALGNGASLSMPSYITSTYVSTASSGYDALTLNMAKAKYTFNANSMQRCVTLEDFKNSIAASGIPGTSDKTLITVANDNNPSTVKVYVTDLDSSSQTLLLSLLATQTLAGISVIYSL